jgi:electron transfer flavoprotein beta subunit
MGAAGARDVIKHGLAMGADEGLLLSDPAFEDGDSYTTALVITTAVKKLGAFDIVFCGRQAVDWDMGVTGSAMAEILGLPIVTIAKGVEHKDGKLVVERVLSDGFETIEVPVPCLVTVSNEMGEPRYPKLQQIMAAARKQVTVWAVSDLGLDASQVGKQGVRLSLERLFIPVVESKCEFVEGDTPAEAANALAQKMREAKLV